MKRFSILITIILPFFGLISLLSLFTPQVHALDVSGPITADTTWTVANSPYIMKDNVGIETGVTLTIEAGVEVIAENDAFMGVSGHLNVMGTPTATTVISNLTSIQIAESGSASIENAQIIVNGTHPLIRYGIGIYGNSNNIISITNSTIENAVYPILTDADSIHRLRMDDVTFTNNINNKVFISVFGSNNRLRESITLKSQPTLEAYEIIDGNYLTIPDGVTLTLDAGVTLLTQGDEYLIVEGNIVANGTETNTVTFSGFPAIEVRGTGATNINHAHIYVHDTHPHIRYGLGISGDSNNLVEIKNSTIENAVYPILTDPESLHRLQMDNVNFSNNVNNKVFISLGDNHYILSDDVTLTAQPNLEGYEIINGYYLTIPDGVTLTLDAGVTLLTQGDEYLIVEGNIVANGTETNTVTFSGFPTIEVRGTGATDINHAHIYVHDTHPHIRYGLGISGDSNNLVEIKNSTIENAVRPVLTDPVSIHRLQMQNVTFNRNINNKVYISMSYPVTSELSQNVTLTAQPGLEGYELLDLNVLNVPQGKTLTLEAGTSLINSIEPYSSLDVHGHLVVNGQITNTALITGFAYIGIFETGSTDINYGHIFANHFDHRMGINIDGNSNNIVDLKNSTIENAVFPIGTIVDSIHRLQMDNVTFANNVNNKVFIARADNPYSNELTQDVFLTAQPGLDGYELYELSSLNVPQGVSLTLEAGATFINSSDNPQNVYISGHLLANGQITNSATITGFSLVAFSETGSGILDHTKIYAGDFYPSLGLVITDNSNNLVSILDSTIENAIYPILTESESFHRLQMENIAFANNINDKIFIDTYGDNRDENNRLSHDVALIPQSGLEGYTVIGNRPLQIPDGITMTVEPGVSLLISDSEKVEVYGRLEAKGTPLNPVTFTSAEDSVAGQWQGIIVHGGEVDLQNTEIRYGISNLSLISPTSQVTISHTNIISASQYGILVQDGQLTLNCSLILDNENAGITIEDSGSPIVNVRQSEFGGNGIAGMTSTHPTMAVNARFNWWGAADGPSGDFAGNGDAVFGLVNASPWLANQPDCTQQITHTFLPIMIKP